MPGVGQRAPGGKEATEAGWLILRCQPGALVTESCCEEPVSSSHASLSSHAQPWGLPTAPRGGSACPVSRGGGPRRTPLSHEALRGAGRHPSHNSWGEEGTNFSSAFASAPSQSLGFNLAFIQEQEIIMWGQGLQPWTPSPTHLLLSTTTTWGSDPCQSRRESSGSTRHGHSWALANKTRRARPDRPQAGGGLLGRVQERPSELRKERPAGQLPQRLPFR